MSLSDDPLDNASPKTRQRYEEALARRRKKERDFQRASPFMVARDREPSTLQEHLSENQVLASEAPTPQELPGAEQDPGENQAWLHQAPTLHKTPGSPAHSGENQVWVRWEYSPEEWRLFERVDWSPIQFRFWLLAGLSLLFLLDIGVLTWSASTENGLVLVLSIVLLCAWIPILMLFAISIDVYSEAIKRHRIRQQEQHAHHITFDNKGLWEAGFSIPLNDLLFSLEKVSLTTEPPVIHFSRTLYAGRRATPHAYPLHVLVPEGHEEEAAALVRRFQIEVIQAREVEKQRQIHRPEPHQRTW